MTEEDDETVRSWRDPVFRAELGEPARAELEPSPVGVLDLRDLPEA